MSEIIKTEEFEQDGSIYIREYYDTGHIVETPKQEEITGDITPSLPQEPKQPTNAEVMQAISDLEANLIIAGVL